MLSPVLDTTMNSSPSKVCVSKRIEDFSRVV